MRETENHGGWPPSSEATWEAEMAKNTGQGFRRGAVTARTQFQRAGGLYQKRNERTGEFMAVKHTPGKFKGVATETDGRDTDNS